MDQATLLHLAKKFSLDARRADFYQADNLLTEKYFQPKQELVTSLERLDLVYRTLCSVLYNFVPQSGHPGGSISSGRIALSLMFDTMEYDFSNPQNESADILSYAAGHKAMGLYAAWALRNEIMRISMPASLPDERNQLRIEDLLGFRRNPVTATPLFKKFNVKPLDGHPTPSTPFVKLATGASGVGMASSVGYALGALESLTNPPWVHILEGEGGMTPGRVQESLATAATAQIHNIVLHVDWNQASIDSNRVCREGAACGDYVQWTPSEILYIHDWNVIVVPDGFNSSESAKMIKVRTCALRSPGTSNAAKAGPLRHGQMGMFFSIAEAQPVSIPSQTPRVSPRISIIRTAKEFTPTPRSVFLATGTSAF